MPIGSFAQRCGLTASALRFYGDAGLLLPARVAPTTGYRLYGEHQLHRAVLLRRLREIGMSLAAVGKALDADPDEAIRLVDEHVDAVVDDAEVSGKSLRGMQWCTISASFRFPYRLHSWHAY